MFTNTQNTFSLLHLKLQIVVIYFDLTKVFDRVNHGLLLATRKTVGIEENSLK